MKTRDTNHLVRKKIAECLKENESVFQRKPKLWLTPREKAEISKKKKQFIRFGGIAFVDNLLIVTINLFINNAKG